MSSVKRLALFDLDHTLLPLDSDYQWADFLARTGRAGDPAEAHRRNEDLMQRYNAGNLTAEQAAEFMLGLLTRTNGAQLAEWHEHYMSEIIRPHIFPAALNLVQEHLAQGDLCAIVTATNQFVTAPIARAFGVPHLIATCAEYSNGYYTGRISGIPSFKEGKVLRVAAWLADMGLALDDFERSYFYSDSPNDIPLLDAVSHPIATNPSPALRHIAETKGWQILELFQHMEDAKS